MDVFNNLGKSLTQGIDRAKFEAEKFQRAAKVQTELNDLKKQVDTKRMEAGDKALDLYRAGQITSATLGQLLRELDTLRTSITLKEDELKLVQNETFVAPQTTVPPSTASQHVPVSVETPQNAAPANGKFCPACGFGMPNSAMFCPNCGTRVGV